MRTRLASCGTGRAGLFGAAGTALEGCGRFMARVTTEDCIDKVENRFDLVMLAAFRARELSKGNEPTLPRENDKNAVIALREIAAETQGFDELNERLIADYQEHNEVDEPEGDDFSPLGVVAPEDYFRSDIKDEPDDSMSEEQLLRDMIRSQRERAAGALGG